MASNFINHSDPTTPLSFNSKDSLEAQYTKLTEREKLIIGAKFLGLNHIPCTFEQFVNDDFFLGDPRITNHGNAIFDCWKKIGLEIYPNPITTKYPYTSFGG